MSDEFFPAAESALAAATASGETPAGWTLTSALYIHLDDARDWREHAARAEHGHEPPRPLYGLPVALTAGAWHSWTLRCESGAAWNQGGRVTYTMGRERADA
jgi:hypothetical protein